MSGRRLKSFDERRQELSSAIKIISENIRDFEKTREIHHLRTVATQLRALIVLKQQSPSLKHPLMIELAKEKNFPLKVFTLPPDLLKTISEIPDVNPDILVPGDPFSLIKDEVLNTEMALEEAMEQLVIYVKGERKTLKELILTVANTEASHYDPGRPPILDDLGSLQLGGLPTHLRIIYSIGKVVCGLGERLIKATI